MERHSWRSNLQKKLPVMKSAQTRDNLLRNGWKESNYYPILSRIEKLTISIQN